jgi:hypothetical protein
VSSLLVSANTVSASRGWLSFGLSVIMDGCRGVLVFEAVELPEMIALHFDEYTTFAPPLADFKAEMKRRGWADRIIETGRCETVTPEPHQSLSDFRVIRRMPAAGVDPTLLIESTTAVALPTPDRHVRRCGDARFITEKGHLMTEAIARVRVPDGGLTNDATELIRDSTNPLIFHHWRWTSPPDVSGDNLPGLATSSKRRRV